MRAPPTIHLLVGAYVGGLVAALAFRPSQGAALGLVGVVALWALACAARNPGRSPQVAASAPGAAGSPAVWRRRLCGSALLGLLPPVAVAGLMVGSARLDAQAHSRLTRFVGHTVDLQATALTLPKVSGERLTLDVEVTAVDGAAVAERAPLTLDLGTAPPPPFTSLGPWSKARVCGCRRPRSRLFRWPSPAPSTMGVTSSGAASTSCSPRRSPRCA